MTDPDDPWAATLRRWPRMASPDIHREARALRDRHIGRLIARLTRCMGRWLVLILLQRRGR